MSGISPASCWITHKRLESWARAAKERALGNSICNHVGEKTASNSNTSNNSVEVVICLYTCCVIVFVIVCTLLTQIEYALESESGKIDKLAVMRP